LPSWLWLLLLLAAVFLFRSPFLLLFPCVRLLVHGSIYRGGRGVDSVVGVRRPEVSTEAVRT
jgi:hypothetical protein